MYFDGSKRHEGAGAGVVLISPKGDRLRYVLQMHFHNPSNNEAEYEALLHGMRMAKACGATRLMIYGDSYLVVQQTKKSCDAISDSMIAYRDLYNVLEGQFEGCDLRHIGRNSNDEADSLANIGSTRSPIPSGVFLEIIHQRSIKEKNTSSPKKLTPIDGEQKPLDPDSPDDLAVATGEEEPDEVLMVEPEARGPGPGSGLTFQSQARPES
ncbi:uncharacterized protein LOC104585552 [Brachypodium distachyon]|uniref:uncharacterized protein LOC104585552 n=1 Tax=Brachypodium distachyon TaxID=15368 RepID=UPI00052FE0EC|nr:uncharacterized protein LOC104585552 [Brachypodium distachyon]|eukprot:XP_010240777.1 uncharacterized protein LOC104585552 [Brachypodium distachyon]